MSCGDARGIVTVIPACTETGETSAWFGGTWIGIVPWIAVIPPGHEPGVPSAASAGDPMMCGATIATIALSEADAADEADTVW